MKGMQLGTLLPIFLFFLLIAGILIIYREEIEKMELFGKLHTSPVSATQIDSPPIPSAPVIPTSLTSSSATPSVSNTRVISFGDGRVVDSTLRNIPIVDLRTGVVGSLHTLSPDVSDYYAQAFVQESSDLYAPSPYVGSVIFLDRVSNVKEADPNREYFVLLVSNALPAPITITGWKVLDRQTRVSYTLPRATKVLESDALPSPVSVYSGDRIFISSGDSPVNTSFQVNKCSGYRSQFENFTPTMKTSCSDPLQEFSDYGDVPFSDAVCYSAVSSLLPCTTVRTAPSDVTTECRRFLQDVLTEKGCVLRHRNDPDFFTGEWRLFLKSNRELWKNRDNVLYLLDENDLLVATLVY